MIITCPRCETAFSLAAELYSPGKKARCSHCGFVFAMPADAQTDAPGALNAEATGRSAAPSPAAGNSRALVVIVSVLLVSLLAYGGYLVFNALLSSSQNGGQTPPAANGKTKEQEERIKTIALEEIRQFVVDNAEIGKLMVIQGFAVNSSGKNKDYVSVEARILDESDTVLARVQQLCGVPLTLFQLQTLPEKDLRQALSNRTTILVNNSDVPPGAKVPFVVIFPNPPESMRTFEVQVVDVRESPPS